MRSTAEEAELFAVGQIAVNAKDLPRATAFYRDVLGLPLLFGTPKMAFFDCGGVRLMLSLPEKPEFDHPSSIIYYKVRDIHAVHRSISERGVDFLSPPHFVAPMKDHELWMAFLRDSEENIVGLMCETPRTASQPS
jgi:methylmalonyl-CoA/ethylmalonyl-CoA epimerase